MRSERPPSLIPPVAQIVLLIFACSCVALLGASYLLEEHVFATLGDAMNDTMLSAATATMTVIGIRMLPKR